MSAEQTRTCDECGGTITADEILRRKAGLVKGRLLCVACVEALRRQIAAERAAASRSQAPAGAAPSREAANAAEETGAATSTATPDSAPHASESDAAAERQTYASPAVSSDEAQSAELPASSTATWTPLPASRATEESPAAAAPVSQAGPVRCMVFHARTTEAGLADLQRRLDVWLREHPDLVVRSSGVTVGPYDGAPGEHRLYVVLHF